MLSSASPASQTSAAAVLRHLSSSGGPVPCTPAPLHPCTPVPMHPYPCTPLPLYPSSQVRHLYVVVRGTVEQQPAPFESWRRASLRTSVRFRGEEAV